MTSNTKILKQTIELLTGELKQVGEYRDNAVRCGVELNKQLAAMTAQLADAEFRVSEHRRTLTAVYAELDAMTAERNRLGVSLALAATRLHTANVAGAFQSGDELSEYLAKGYENARMALEAVKEMGKG
jgi:hypothetical protein